MRTRSDLTRRDLRVAGSPPRRGTGWHWCSAKYGRGRASRLREPRLALVLLRRCVRLRASRARWAPLVHAFDSRRLHQFSPLKNHDLSNDSALRPASEWGTRQHRAHGMLSPCPYPWLWIRRVSLTAAWGHAGPSRITLGQNQTALRFPPPPPIHSSEERVPVRRAGTRTHVRISLAGARATG